MTDCRKGRKVGRFVAIDGGEENKPVRRHLRLAQTIAILTVVFAASPANSSKIATICDSDGIKQAIVPDAKTAIAIAESISPGQGLALWLPKLRPFEAHLDRGIWWVTSQLDRSINPPRGLIVQINRCDGRVKMFSIYPVD